ncbi:hypothetical protein V2J09_015126 [Rumex salicifolius]
MENQKIFLVIALILATIYFEGLNAELKHLKHTPKHEDGSLNFLVIGDWGRRGFYNQSLIADQMANVAEKLDMDFVVSTGDNFYDNGLVGIDDPNFEESFTNVYNASSLQTQWYSVLGNHDYRGDVEAQLSEHLRKKDKRWLCMRSFILDAGTVDFFFIDTTPFVDTYFLNPLERTFDWRGIYPRRKYMSSILGDLSLALNSSTATWKMVVGHHTIKSACHHGVTGELVVLLLPILWEHKVDFYLNGHDHCLERISSIEGNTEFITSGGGSKAWRGDWKGWSPEELEYVYGGQGFLSVQANSTMASFQFIDVNGDTLHQWSKTKELRIIFCFQLVVLNGEMEIMKTVAKDEDGSLSFLVVGDWGRRGLYNQSLVSSQMGKIGEKLDIDFIISTGDNFYEDGLTGSNDPAFFESFSNIYTSPSLQVPWFSDLFMLSVLGNHDYRGDVEAQISLAVRQKDKRWLCFRSFIVNAGIVDFFFVDTTPFVDEYFLQPGHHTYDWRGVLPRDNYISTLLKVGNLPPRLFFFLIRDLVWSLSSALKKSKATWKIVVGHHTIKSAGHHGVTMELAAQLEPILQENNVDFYLNGHDHCLEHITSLHLHWILKTCHVVLYLQRLMWWAWWFSNTEYITSGGGSKAWRGDVHQWNPDELKFYHDGQGFLSVQLNPDVAKFAFYDVFGNVLHQWDVPKQALSEI